AMLAAASWSRSSSSASRGLWASRIAATHRRCSCQISRTAVGSPRTAAAASDSPSPARAPAPLRPAVPRSAWLTTPPTLLYPQGCPTPPDPSLLRWIRPAGSVFLLTLRPPPRREGRQPRVKHHVRISSPPPPPLVDLALRAAAIWLFRPHAPTLPDRRPDALRRAPGRTQAADHLRPGGGPAHLRGIADLRPDDPGVPGPAAAGEPEVGGPGPETP